MQNNCSEEFIRLVNEKELGQQELKKRLQKIYEKNLPKFAEIVVNPFCPNKCKHCIYPDDYSCFNKSLGIKLWKEILGNLYHKLKFRHFIFGGRGLNNLLFEIIKYLNESFPDAKIGLIADGPAIEKYYDKFIKLKIDHLDISVDGLKQSHDVQRNYPGSFEITLKVIKRLLDESIGKSIDKLSILVTLTSINKDEILPMIKYLNKEFGLKNFFITPVSAYAGRPDSSLKLSTPQLAKFIKAASGFSKTLEDSYLCFNIYDDELLSDLIKYIPEFPKLLKPSDDYFEFAEFNGNNEFHLFWYPIAINGCREFIVNSDGNIFTGLVQALGKIPLKFIFGNILNIKEDRKIFFDNLVKSSAFDFYVEYLKKNREHLVNKWSHAESNCGLIHVKDMS